MKPESNKKVSGGVFTTDEGLKINIPPKNIIDKALLKRELLKMQEEYLMEIETTPYFIEKNENEEVIKRIAEDGRVLTSKEKAKTDEKKNSGIDR